MAPMDRDVAVQKLQSLAAGAALARKRLAAGERTVGWGSGKLGKSARNKKRRWNARG
jgi:hypothetical protein